MTNPTLTTRFRRPAIASGKQIQRAIRDDEYDTIPEMLSDPELLWESNSRGWTAMHVACCGQPPLRCWRLLLQKASLVDPQRLCQTKTDMGQTCIDLFFRQALFPLAWCNSDVKAKARRLRNSIEEICNPSSEKVLEELRRKIQASGHAQDDGKEPKDERDAVEVVSNFWRRLELLLCAAHSGTVDINSLENKELAFLQLLASQHWCPGPVCRLLVALLPKIPPLWYHPLHIWVKTKTFVCEDAGMLETLCTAYPEAASVGDNGTGRIPLHTALLRGKSWKEVEALFKIFPEAALLVDRISGLPAFCLPSLVSITSPDIEVAAKRHDQQRLSVWKYISKRDRQKAIQQAQVLLDCQRVDTIFQLLRRHPSALQSALQCTPN